MRSPEQRRARDGGAITPYVALLSLSLVLVLGLISSGGLVFAARQAAFSEAEQAARAGASTLDMVAISSGALQPDGIGAVRAAEMYMTATGHPGTAQVLGNTVRATVSPFRVSTPLLSLVGIDSIVVTASATATVVSG